MGILFYVEIEGNIRRGEAVDKNYCMQYIKLAVTLWRVKFLREQRGHTLCNCSLLWGGSATTHMHHRNRRLLETL